MILPQNHLQQSKWNNYSTDAELDSRIDITNVISHDSRERRNP